MQIQFGDWTKMDYTSGMNIEEIRDYYPAKPGVTEGFPFNDTALVFKGPGKCSHYSTCRRRPGASA